MEWAQGVSDSEKEDSVQRDPDSASPQTKEAFDSR